ncbi:Uncharacterised protein [Mycobacteroides abscessus subsp. abscessus]|nr:Uncharacterised protein [Mycobacteroides abscessus subsp. abscessus]
METPAQGQPVDPGFPGDDLLRGLREHPLGLLGGGGQGLPDPLGPPVHDPQGRGLHDRPADHPGRGALRVRGQQQVPGGVPARRLPGHGDVARVPAEGRDVPVRPAQGLELIQQPGVGFAGAGVAEVAEQPQPVGHADHDHALLPHQPARIVVREVPGAAGVGAAVDPQQHRQVRAPILRPGDAQPLAVLVEAEGDQPLIGVLVALGAGRGGNVRGEGMLRTGLRVGEGCGSGEALGLGVPDAPGPHDAVLAHRAEGARGRGDDLPGADMLRGVGHGPSLSGPVPSGAARWRAPGGTCGAPPDAPMPTRRPSRRIRVAAAVVTEGGRCVRLGEPGIAGGGAVGVGMAPDEEGTHQRVRLL